MKKFIEKYLSENKKSITILFLCVMIGLVIGIVTYQFIDSGVKNELCKSIKSTLDITKQDGFQGINVIKNGIVSNAILCIIIYIISLTLIAPGAMCILDIFKGFTIGLYIPTLFQIFGFGNGLLSTLLLVILPNIIYLPAFIFICTNAINFHYNLIDKSSSSSKVSIILKEAYLFVFGFSVMFLSVIIEQFTSLGVISIYKGLM